MNQYLALFIYSAAIAAGSFAGGAIPMLAKVRGRRMDLLLAFSAGVMLGAAFFHMLPEAVHEGGPDALAITPLGFLVLYTLERYVLVHVCQEPEDGCEAHGHMGMAAFLGLSVHTIFDGIALGSSLSVGLGGLVFLAVVAHKIPASLTLSSILVHDHYRPRKVFAMLFLFAMMVPLGAVIYLAVRNLTGLERITAFSLAFSAGTFLHIALADLLPQVHKRSESRWYTVAMLMMGMGSMWALNLFHHAH